MSVFKKYKTNDEKYSSKRRERNIRNNIKMLKTLIENIYILNRGRYTETSMYNINNSTGMCIRSNTLMQVKYNIIIDIEEKIVELNYINHEIDYKSTSEFRQAEKQNFLTDDYRTRKILNDSFMVKNRWITLPLSEFEKLIGVKIDIDTFDFRCKVSSDISNEFDNSFFRKLL